MMMHPFARVGTLLSFLVVAAADPIAAQQDTIRITHGTFVFDVSLFGFGQGEIHASGTQGFRLGASVNELAGFFPIVDECRLAGCAPGATLNLFATWSGLDLPGGARLQGRSYELGGFETASALVQFTGMVTLPPLEEGPVNVLAPFSFAGLFSTPDFRQFTLTGGGVVTVSVVPHPFEVGRWFIEQVTFEFSPRRQR